MKRILLFAASICLAACSDTTQTGVEYHSRIAEAEPDPDPSYTGNPYDVSGQLFDDLFEGYFADSLLPSAYSDIALRIEVLAQQHGTFNNLKPQDYQPVSGARIDTAMTNPAQYATYALSQLGASLNARTQLETFAYGVVAVCDATDAYAPVRDYVIAFEQQVLADGTLSMSEREKLLTVASIVRYSAYRARKKPKKNKDPEWELLITHIAGGVEGAEAGICEAVTMALATGIAANR